MPSNIEIKAKARDMPKLRDVAAQLSGADGEVIIQEDIFYNVPSGRLKLRKMQNQPSELIFYDRPDTLGPKRSNFKKETIPNPEELNSVLSLALGVKGVVKKKRELYIVGQTRVHIDVVEGLGHFMELEVMLTEEQTSEDGQTIAENLMQELGIESRDLLSGAYVDILLEGDTQNLS